MIYGFLACTLLVLTAFIVNIIYFYDLHQKTWQTVVGFIGFGLVCFAIVIAFVYGMLRLDINNKLYNYCQRCKVCEHTFVED